MLTDEQMARFDRDGFVLGGRVVDDAELEELRSELDRVTAQREESQRRQPVMVRNLSGDDNQPVWQIVNIWEASEPFRRLTRHAGIAGAVAQLTRSQQLRIWHDQIQYKPARTGGATLWHQDSPYWGILQPKDAQVTAWVALDDVDEENGCMRMVRGSHLWGEQIEFLHQVRGSRMLDDMPAEFDGRPIEVRLCPVPRGHVHFHHSLTWHGSHLNLSHRPRRAIAIHLMTEDTIYDGQGQHVMKPYVEVAPGERMRGAHFPVVWDNGSAKTDASPG